MFANCDINRNISVNTCRACLQTKKDGCVLLKHNSELSQLYEFCVGIPVHPDDLPQVLCTICERIIKDFANFKKQCLDANKLCKSIADQDKHKEKCSVAREIKPELTDWNYDADNFCQDDYVNDNGQCNYLASQHKDYEYELEDNSIKRRKKCPVKSSHEQQQQKSELKNLHITYKQEIDVSNSDNEFDKEGFIKVLECTKCKKQYKKNKCLIKHMTQTCFKHVNVNELVVIKKYRPAIAKVEDTPEELFCGICNFKMIGLNDLKQHLRKHWDDNDLECKLCGYTGLDFAELIGHRSAHQPYEFFSKLANRTCHICDNRSVTIMRLQFHYRSVHLEKNGGLCSVCRKTFRSYTAWRNHERLHKGSKYICDLCGHKFLFRNQIKSHLAEHLDVRANICDICGKGFKRASYLKEHFNTVHTKEPVKCSHCDKTFNCPTYLKEHLKNINKAKNFQCEVCFKYFASQTLVNNHMFWHSDERPYGCEECGARYKAKAYLKIHMRKHTGHRPYQCQQCDKCFPTPMQLKRHRSVHTGDRPYKCTICARSFYYKKMLLTHYVSKHNYTDFKSDANL